MCMYVCVWICVSLTHTVLLHPAGTSMISGSTPRSRHQVHGNHSALLGWVQVCSGAFHPTFLPSLPTTVPPQVSIPGKFKGSSHSQGRFFLCSQNWDKPRRFSPRIPWQLRLVLGQKGRVARPWGLRAVPLLHGRGLGSCETHERRSPSQCVFWGCFWPLPVGPGLSTLLHASCSVPRVCS